MEYRPYSQLTDIPHVVVDGSAQPGTALTLSHWPGSATPDALRRNLSAEIAFAYLDHPELHQPLDFVTNNHFDQDGIVSVFALTEPDAALARRDRLIDVARAGDFGRFHERDAARAAIALANLGGQSDDDAYETLLPRLADIVDHVDRYRDAWAEEDTHITATETAIADGTITVADHPDLDLAIVTVPESWQDRIVHQFTMVAERAAHPYAVNNATDSFAVITVGGAIPEFQYRYETWVHYVSRRPRPRVDLTGAAAALTAADGGPGKWVFDAIDGLSPRLHLVGAADTTIGPSTFINVVTAELRAAGATWSPYD